MPPKRVNDDDHREAFISSVNELLHGSYNADGIAEWWRRPRARLGGHSPADLMNAGFDPSGTDAKAIYRLAQELTGPGDAT